jgi:hypothetical protein
MLGGELRPGNVPQASRDVVGEHAGQAGVAELVKRFAVESHTEA